MKEPERTKVAITGAKGIIGTILTQGLKDFEILPIDLPEVDVRDYDQLKNSLQGQDIVIHLAWDTEIENFHTGKINPDNLLMVVNIYKAAQEKSVKRVIMASSIHADQFLAWQGEKLMSPDLIPVPDSLYGASKVFAEALGRHFATRGLEVVCIRFGGVTFQDQPTSTNVCERASHLKQNDCIGLVKICLNAKNIPNNFLIVYGVSDNEGRILDYSNPLGWQPKEGVKTNF